MLQVENEFEDTERDWFEIQSDQHSKLRRIVVKRLWMIQFDLKMVDPRKLDLAETMTSVLTDETIQIGIGRSFDI